MQLCGILITGPVLVAHPKYSLSHGKSLCTLIFISLVMKLPSKDGFDFNEILWSFLDQSRKWGQELQT